MGWHAAVSKALGLNTREIESDGDGCGGCGGCGGAMSSVVVEGEDDVNDAAAAAAAAVVVVVVVVMIAGCNMTCTAGVCVVNGYHQECRHSAGAVVVVVDLTIPHQVRNRPCQLLVLLTRQKMTKATALATATHCQHSQQRTLPNHPQVQGHCYQHHQHHYHHHCYSHFQHQHHQHSHCQHHQHQEHNHPKCGQDVAME